ncbi:MAG: Ig-like domain-containing protein [Treponema sp.]|jgi:uncharacterized protein YjdB|nr:Ig-like domain-containing protein [Treponema sp.]
MKKYLRLSVAVLAALSFIFAVAGCGGGNNGVPVDVESVTLSTSAKIAADNGEAFPLTATVLPQNASNKNVTWEITEGNDKVELSRTTGGSITVKPKAAGKAKIKAKAGGFESEPCEVTVIASGSFKAVTGITLDKTEEELFEGFPLTITASPAPSDASNKAVIWSAEEGAGFIRIEPNGLKAKITGIAEGRAVVKVTTDDGGKTASCSITVKAFEGEHVTGVRLNKTKETITEGKTLELTAAVSPNDAAIKDLTWSVSKSGVVSLSAAEGASVTVTAAAAGTVTVSVTTLDGGKRSSCAITVTKKDEGKDPDEYDIVNIPLSKRAADGMTIIADYYASNEGYGMIANSPAGSFVVFSFSKTAASEDGKSFGWLSQAFSQCAEPFELKVPAGTGTKTEFQYEFTKERFARLVSPWDHGIVFIECWGATACTKVELWKPKGSGPVEPPPPPGVSPFLKNYPELTPEYYAAECADTWTDFMFGYSNLSGLKYDQDLAVTNNPTGYWTANTKRISGAEFQKIENAPEGSAIVLYIRTTGSTIGKVNWKCGYVGFQDHAVTPAIDGISYRVKKVDAGISYWFQGIKVSEALKRNINTHTGAVLDFLSVEAMEVVNIDKVELWIPE